MQKAVTVEGEVKREDVGVCRGVERWREGEGE